MGRYTFAAGAPVVQVTIPRVNILQPQAAATLQFFTVINPGCIPISAWSGSSSANPAARSSPMSR